MVTNYLNSSECLAGVRGFELTHSRSNPVSARAFANLGIWLGRPRPLCSNSGSASRLHPELFRGAKTVVWHTDCSDSNRGATDVTASRRSDRGATPDTAPVRLAFSGAAATVNFLPEELRLPSRRRSCDQVALPKVSKIL